MFFFYKIITILLILIITVCIVYNCVVVTYLMKLFIYGNVFSQAR